MSEVEKTLTPLSETDVALVLKNAWIDLYGNPTAEILGVAWADIAMENKHGRAIYNWNFGNITTPRTDIDYYTLTTNEKGHDGVWRMTKLKYPAHTNEIEGAKAYWSLVTNEHYQSAFTYFETGDAHSAAMKLHELGYFTADPAPIANTLQRNYAYFLDKILPQTGLPPPLPECPGAA